MATLKDVHPSGAALERCPISLRIGRASGSRSKGASRPGLMQQAFSLQCSARASPGRCPGLVCHEPVGLQYGNISRTPARYGYWAPQFHNSITPTLHHSTTPQLHHSNTPQLPRISHGISLPDAAQDGAGAPSLPDSTHSSLIIHHSSFTPCLPSQGSNAGRLAAQQLVAERP